MATENVAWQLEDFVDSLVVELDKTRETLAVKAINKPLSYTVKEVALDLNIFPAYDGDEPHDGYAFDGFKIELSEKSMLTPAAGSDG